MGTLEERLSEIEERLNILEAIVKELVSEQTPEKSCSTCNLSNNGNPCKLNQRICNDENNLKYYIKKGE